MPDTDLHLEDDLYDSLELQAMLSEDWALLDLDDDQIEGGR